MLDYEYINVLAEILLDETCSEKVRKLRFEIVKKIQEIVKIILTDKNKHAIIYT